MALLQVSPEMLAQSLFQGAAPGVEIIGASFDHQRGIVLLEIAGHSVPDTEYVTAIMTKQRFDVKFESAAGHPAQAHVEVIEPPNAYEAQCTHCGCKFRYSYAALDKLKAGTRRLTQLFRLGLACPGCGRNHYHGGD